MLKRRSPMYGLLSYSGAAAQRSQKYAGRIIWIISLSGAAIMAGSGRTPVGTCFSCRSSVLYITLRIHVVRGSIDGMEREVHVDVHVFGNLSC